MVLSIIQKAANKGITRQAIANQISTEVMPRTQVIKAVDSLEKSGLVKSFKSVNVRICGLCPVLSADADSPGPDDAPVHPRASEAT